VTIQAVNVARSAPLPGFAGYNDVGRGSRDPTDQGAKRWRYSIDEMKARTISALM